MTQITPPTDDDVRESVERVADRMLPRLRAPRALLWRRRIIAIVAGLGLFAGGLGVGAAAYGAAVGPRIDVEPAFAIDCYPDAGSPKPAVRIGMDSPELMGDPVASCHTEKDAQIGSDVSDAAARQYLVTGQAECILISSPGSPDWYMWKSGQDATSHALTPFWVREPGPGDQVAYEGSSTKPAGFPSTCLPVNIPAVATPQVALGACKVDAHHAAVFPLGPQSVRAVCRARHLAVWTTTTR